MGFGRRFLGSHSPSYGLRQCFKLARVVSESLPVSSKCWKSHIDIGVVVTLIRHLKPGVGHFEQVEIDMRPRCDDETLPYKPIAQWYDWLEDATARASRSIAYQRNTQQMLQSQGFVDIEETVIRLPFNSWPSDSHQKEIGRWYNLGLTEGLEAVSLGPLTRCFQWPPADVRRLVTEIKPAICNKRYHAYNNL